MPKITVHGGPTNDALPDGQDVPVDPVDPGELDHDPDGRADPDERTDGEDPGERGRNLDRNDPSTGKAPAKKAAKKATAPR